MIPRLRFFLEGGGNGFNQDAYNLLRILTRDFIMCNIFNSNYPFYLYSFFIVLKE